jgi:predicted negative regulator of RcsB-dependent stress response
VTIPEALVIVSVVLTFGGGVAWAAWLGHREKLNRDAMAYQERANIRAQERRNR